MDSIARRRMQATATPNYGPPFYEGAMKMIFDLAREGDTDGVRQAIERGADVNAKDARGVTPLHLAASHGRTETAVFLLQNGADVNVKNELDNVPLHWAALNGHTEIAGYLLQSGSDVNTKNKYGETPLHLAASFGRTETAVLLLQNGADFSAKNGDGATPFEIVMEEGCLALLHAFCTMVVENILDAKDVMIRLRGCDSSTSRQALAMIEAMTVAKMSATCAPARQGMSI